MNVPVKSHQDLEDEKVNFIHLILEALGEGWGLGRPPASPVPQTRWAVGLGVPVSPLTHSLTLGLSLPISTMEEGGSCDL